MNTPVFDKLAFLYGYVSGDPNYWTVPWLALAHIADDINKIGYHWRGYRPLIATFTFINSDGHFDAVQL
jgi:hypothetical protein